MKKITFLMVFMLSSLAAFSGNGWLQDYVLINLNGDGTAGGTDGTGYYWIGTDPSYGTKLDGTVFGTVLAPVTSLVIDGCDMRYWNDGATRPTGGAFYYMIKSADNTTEVVPATEVIWTQNSLGGNDYQGLKSGPSIDLLSFSGIKSNTTYKLHIWAKNWNGQDGGDSWLNNGGNNYQATFTTGTIVHTGVSKLETSLQLSGANGKVTARFDGSAKVELFNVSGQLMHTATVSNEFTQQVPSGAYLLRINGKTHKVLVR